MAQGLKLCDSDHFGLLDSILNPLVLMGATDNSTCSEQTCHQGHLSSSMSPADIGKLIFVDSSFLYESGFFTEILEAN